MTILATILGGAVQLSGNPVEIKCTGGSAPSGSSNYQIILKIISEDGKLEFFPKTDAKDPDTNGEAVFDISGYVDQPVKAVFEYPVTNPYVAYPTQAFNVQVQPGESYLNSSGLLVENWGAVSSVFQILKGGISQRQLNMMRDASTNFYDTYISAGKFLTARPQGDIVHPTQPVKLWFMPASTIAGATWNIKGFYDDGTDVTYSTEIDIDVDNLYEFNCNPADVGLTLEPSGKQMIYFDVWLESEGSFISDVRRFNFDWNYCERPVFLLFANTFGGVDDVYFSGYIQDRFSVSGNTSFQPAQRDDTVLDPTLIVTNKSGQNKWTINSGYKELTIMQFLRDLLVTRQAWYIYSNLTQTTTIVIPIIIDDVDVVLVDRKENIYALELQFSEAHTSQFSFDNRIY
jgi:hypothetical protein